MNSFSCDNKYSSCIGTNDGVRLNIPPANANLVFDAGAFEEFMGRMKNLLTFRSEVDDVQIQVTPTITTFYARSGRQYAFQTREFMNIVYAYFAAQQRD